MWEQKKKHKNRRIEIKKTVTNIFKKDFKFTFKREVGPPAT